MTTPIHLDLRKLKARAFDRAEWAEPSLRRFHAAVATLDADLVQPLRGLYQWMFVPTTLWPFNIQDVLEDCLTALEQKKPLSARHRMLLELLPEPPNDAVCAAVADHELHVQKGTYENLVKTQVKYSQNEIAICNDPQLCKQWARIKLAFDVQNYCDHKGVIRRTMTAERNMRPSFSVNMRRPEDVFHAAFDAFCLRWSLYGMQHDKPLLLKLAVNLTPYGTMIHIPAYWSFDPKRDIRWDAIAQLHRVRVAGRQGRAIAENKAERMKSAEKLRLLDQSVIHLGLKGEKKHKFLCAGLGWVLETSPKRISRLRAEFKNQISFSQVK